MSAHTKVTYERLEQALDSSGVLDVSIIPCADEECAEQCEICVESSDGVRWVGIPSCIAGQLYTYAFIKMRECDVAGATAAAAVVLCISPGSCTAWAVRKRYVLTQSSATPGNCVTAFELLRFEQRLSDALLPRALKAPEMWEHRGWIVRELAQWCCVHGDALDAIRSMLAAERRAAARATGLRRRCYAAWTHRLLTVKVEASLQPPCCGRCSRSMSCATAVMLPRRRVGTPAQRAGACSVVHDRCTDCIGTIKGVVCAELEDTRLHVTIVPADASAWHFRSELLQLLLTLPQIHPRNAAVSVESAAAGNGHKSKCDSTASDFVDAERQLIKGLTCTECETQVCSSHLMPRRSCALAYALRRATYGLNFGSCTCAESTL